MIVLSKFLIGSIALTTLAGSAMLPDAVDALRGFADALRLSVTGADADIDAKSVRQSADAEAPFLPSGPRQCAGSCDFWAALSQIR